MKPRSPFSRKGKGDGYVNERGHDLDIDKFYEVKYKLKDKIEEKHLTPEYKKTLHRIFRLEKELSRYKNALIIIITIIIMGTLALCLKKMNDNYIKRNTYEITKTIVENDKTIVFTYFRDYNDIRSIKRYKGNKLDGICTFYYDNQLESVEKYNLGRLYYKVDYDDDFYIKFKINSKGNIYFAQKFDYENKLIRQGKVDVGIWSEGRIYFKFLE